LLLALILSIVILQRNRSLGYLRFFPFYHGCSVLTEIFADYYFPTSNPYNHSSNMPYNIFTLIEFLFFAFYIYSSVKTGRRLILTSVMGFLTLYTLLMYKSEFECTFHFTLLLQNVFLLIPCILYFNDVFTTFSSSNLAKEPAFWIVTGIMFYSIITTPTQIYRFVYKLDSEVRGLIYVATNGTAYILMYVLFVKAYTCKVSK
jgi:hypothetical protein